MSNFSDVKHFMETFGQDVLTVPTLPDESLGQLRIDLMVEELNEVIDAMNQGDVVNLAKELCDLVYVCLGAAAAFGISFDECFKEVQRSNMSKLTKDGKVLRREDGKVLKSDQYSPANLEPILFPNK